MRFTYCYKSSDGIRHEEKIEAQSREEVFAVLRQRGIRAIKVYSDYGTKANGEVKFIVGKRLAAACAVIGLLAGIFSVIAVKNVEIDIRSKHIKTLDKSTQTILFDHKERMDAAKTFVLDNPGRVAAETAQTDIARIVSTGYLELNTTRTKLRELFRPVYEQLPDEKEREEVNQLYAASMYKLDIEEAKLSRSKKACEFLQANRGRWKFQNGKIVFLDRELAQKYLEFSHEL